MNIIVQKYGGQAVANLTRIKNIAQYIAKNIQKNKIKVVAVVSAMAGETNRLINLGKEVNPNPQGREFDLLVSTGEQVSTALLALAAQKLELKAISLLGFHINLQTTTNFTNAKILSVDKEKLLKSIAEYDLVTVAGFQGITSQGDITTLGRGGSDITAVAVAAALNQNKVEFYKDVDGIFTADPDICPKAK